MARITKAQREANKESYDAAIYQLFLDVGWEQLTYERVAKHLNVKKSTLQSYYPSKHDFFLIWEGKHMPMFYEKADFRSREAFLTSWQAILDDKFLSVLIRYAIASSVTPVTEKSRLFKSSVMAPIIKELEKNLPDEDAFELLTIMLGMAVIVFAQQHSPDSRID
jgi:AcrR family transcriptional regulator